MNKQQTKDAIIWMVIMVLVFIVAMGGYAEYRNRDQDRQQEIDVLRGRVNDIEDQLSEK